MVEAAIVELIKDRVEVTNIIGAGDNARIYPHQAGQANATHPRPFVVYRRIGTERTYSNSGYSGLASPRIQVDCVASDYATARLLADEIRLALQAFRGTVGGIVVCAIFLDEEMDISEERFEGHEQPVERVVLDFLVWHHEVKPDQPH